MALINCPECGKEISDSSEKCIHCGYPLKKKNHNKGIVKAMIGVAVAAVIIAIILLVKPGNNNTCKLDQCKNKVYSNGYCVEHYGQVRNGEDVSTTKDNDSAEKSAVETKEETSNNEGFSEDTEEALSFAKNSTISTDSCEFTLLGYNIANKIEPSNFKASYYHYYEAAAGNVFIDVKFSIKNKATKDVTQDKVLKSVKIIYDGEYEYRCSFVTVDKDGDFEGFTSLYSISPLETMEYHMLAEVPTEVENSSGSLVCRVDVDGQTYECKLR